MNARYRYVILFLLILGICGFFLSFRNANAQKGGVVQQPGGAGGGAVLSPKAQRQIAALLAEKQALSPAQRKIESSLRYGIKKQRGEMMTANGEVATLRSADAVMKKVDAGGRMEVDVRGKVEKTFLTMIENYGGKITRASEKGGYVRAWVPVSALESLAENEEVKAIRPAAQAITHAQLDRARMSDLLPTPFPLEIKQRLQGGLRPDLKGRAADIGERVKDALARAETRKREYRNQAAPQNPPAQANTGSVVSEGDTAMGAQAARNFFGVNGAGVKVGVLSSGVANLAESIASGDLPPDVTVLPGQEGVGDGEGTAIMEIIHDLAPGAKLYFATAVNSEESFADNIRALRAAGCDIIVDDVIYFVESPFHDDIVSTAVEEVVADGALYFSSAGNEGNVNNGTGSAWEGDFKNSRTTLSGLPGGTLHEFGAGLISDLVISDGTEGPLGLFWSDPLGASDNDYDIFVLDSALTTVLEAGTTVQDGDDDPIELINGAFAGERIIIYKADSAKKRALHLDNFGGTLGLATSGSTHGHNSVAGAFGVAAIDAALANGGTFSGGPTNPVEYFSSDGYRRVFYRSDGSPITPGNLLFSSNGGELRKKPDLTGVDGVSTSVPGFSPFYGTSAAAPHVAAVAALLKSAKPKAAQTRIRNVLAKTAIDVEALHYDRDSGAGIADAFAALLEIGASPAPLLESGAFTVTDVGGNGNGKIEPGEGGSLVVPLTNIGGATAVGVSATLTTTTPGVTIVTATSGYPSIGSSGQSVANSVPFTFSIPPTFGCGQPIDFALTVNYSNSPVGTQVFPLRVLTGGAGPETVVSYTGPVVPIPDANPTGVSIPLVVSGVGTISGLKFRFDGSSCSSDIGSTTVGLDHTYVGDLVVTLTSPQGTTVTLINRMNGGIGFAGGNDGNNFCNTVLDDAATATIQDVGVDSAPFTGTFKPANPLAAFNGQVADGTWMLTVSDIEAADIGNVRAFSLVITPTVCAGP